MQPTNSFREFGKLDTNQTISNRFEEQARIYAGRLAVKTRSQSLTYDDLNRASNRVAHAVLAEHGFAREPIALLCKQGTPLITAVLGVLKAGKSYVMIHHRLPHSRITQILHDTESRLVLTDTYNFSLAQQLSGRSSSVLNLEEIDTILPDQNPGLLISPDEIAYINYTSGSTGSPQGVTWNHRNELFGISIKTKELHISAEDRVSLVRSNNVGATRDMFLGLLNGAALVIFDFDEERLAHLGAWLTEERITIFTCVVTIFRHAAQSANGKARFPTVRLIHVGGEPLTKSDLELYKQHFSDECIMVNRYSISETQAVSYYFINKQTEIKDERVPVGYPLEGNEIVVLDEDGNKAGISQVGEIIVKSPYLALGYWRKPELTSLKFQIDSTGGATRIYRTGDLGYMLPDGCLVYVGRKDFQVKISGHKVNADEIETMLLAISCIKEAAVVARESISGHNRLIAYLVFKSESDATISQIRDLLSERIPLYMIPSVFVVLSVLPLTPSGKIDRQALPEPPRARPELDAPFTPPRTDVERKLAQIWSELFELDVIGIDDNFFELGGDSLLASRLVTRVNEQFHTELTVANFFGFATVAKLSRAIPSADNP